MSDPYTFTTRSYEWRLRSGEEAIENRLKEEVIRADAKHAFVVCSRSIASKTRRVERVKESLKGLYAGAQTMAQDETDARQLTGRFAALTLKDIQPESRTAVKNFSVATIDCLHPPAA